jgi:hypothetical protein
MSIGISNSETAYCSDVVVDAGYTTVDTSLSATGKKLKNSISSYHDLAKKSVSLQEFKESLRHIVFLTAGEMVEEFCKFSQKHFKTDPGLDQVAYEVLSIGVLWCNYSNASQGSSKIALSALQFIDKEREKLHWFKVAIDPIRGALSTLFLFPYFHSAVPVTLKIDYTSFLQLIEWLEVVGEYKQEVSFLHKWKLFFQEKTLLTIEEYLRKAAFLGQWFEIHSRKALSPFIPHMAESKPVNKTNESNTQKALFRSRKETEFFLKLIISGN